MLTLPPIEIVGKPHAKGSMIPMVSHTTGRAIMRPDNDFDQVRWSGKVQAAAMETWQRPLLRGAVAVFLEFRTPRPSREYHEKDLDKLARSVLDALTKAQAFKDDKQVALLLAVKYHIRASNPLPGVRIILSPIEDSHDIIPAALATFYESIPRAAVAGATGGLARV